jgi:hypothetical protein
MTTTRRTAIHLAATATSLLLLLPGTAEALPAFGTAPVDIHHDQSVPPVPTVTGLRVGRHATYDRVVFDIDNPVVRDIRVRYVDVVRQDGSGAPVRLAGKAFIQVTLGGATGIDDDAALTFSPTDVKPRFPTLKEVRFVSSFEGYTTFGLGVSKKVGFRVFELPDPYRVVVDVARS